MFLVVVITLYGIELLNCMQGLQTPLFTIPQSTGLFAPPRAKVANLKQKDFLPLQKIEVKATVFDGPATFDGDALLEEKRVSVTIIVF
jgi:hypothetical protein